MENEKTLNFRYGEYDMDTYQELLKKPSEKWTDAEREYCIFCYHYEEWEAGML